MGAEPGDGAVLGLTESESEDRVKTRRGEAQRLPAPRALLAP